MKFWETKSFKAIRDEWYQNLEQNGFKDIEKVCGEELVLRQFSQHVFKNVNDLAKVQKESYFASLSHAVHHAEFDSEVDKLVLTLYADGQKIKTICAELERIGESRCRGAVRFMIRRYEHQWGMRKYTPKQLNRKIK